MVSTTSSATELARATSLLRRLLPFVSVSRTAAAIRLTALSVPRLPPVAGWSPRNWVVPQYSWLLTLLTPSTAMCCMSMVVFLLTLANSRSKITLKCLKWGDQCHPILLAIQIIKKRLPIGKPLVIFINKITC